MLGACVFEKQYGGFGSGVILAPGTNFDSNILKVGAPSDEDGAAFDGVLVRFWLYGFGGTADSGVTITVYRSFDGVNVDDAALEQIAIAAANIGEYPAQWYQTMTYPTVPRESGRPACGYAMRMNIAHDDVGDRVIIWSMRRRRWRWKVGL